MKILITGSHGMLGSALCNFFNEKNKVFAFHRDQKSYVKCTESINLDLLEFSKFEKYVIDIKPDLIIHCSGLTNVEECEINFSKAYEQNVVVTANIAKLCKDKIKLIYISTDQVYGSLDNFIESNNDYKPLNNYGKTKLGGEKKVIQFCKNYMIIRTNIFGWNIKKNKISSAEWIYSCLKNEQKLILFQDYYFCPIYTIKLGRIIQKLLELNFNGILNIGSETACSKYQFGKFLAKEAKYNSKVITRGLLNNHSFKALRHSKLIFNYDLIFSLGIKIPNFKESIIDFLKDKKDYV